MSYSYHHTTINIFLFCAYVSTVVTKRYQSTVPLIKLYTVETQTTNYAIGWENALILTYFYDINASIPNIFIHIYCL